MVRADRARRLVGTVAHLSAADRWGASTTWIAVLFHHISSNDTARDTHAFVDGLGVTMKHDTFINCVRYLARRYEVVTFAELVSFVRSVSARPKMRTRQRMLICFDDAYASVVDLAAPVLAELGLPWCFFINPSLVGNSVLAADNAAAYVANTFGLDPLSRAADRPVSSVADFIHHQFTACTPVQRRDLISGLLNDVGIDPHEAARKARLYVEATDVRRLADAGVEIGNHTADHVYCRTLSLESVNEQVLDSARAVAALSGRPVRGFAYPYGNRLDRTSLVTSALRTSGHECAFLVHNRINTARTDPWGFYRISPSSGDPRILAAELEIQPRIRIARETLKGAARRARGVAGRQPFGQSDAA
jgi:peptidoglycan/xylan/chitin deacetylase (PgdA/CDA1 family)